MAKARKPAAKKAPSKVAAKRSPAKPRPKPAAKKPARKPAPKKVAPVAPARKTTRDLMEAIGFEVIVELIAKGKSLRNICACPDLHITPGIHAERRTLMRFLTATEQRAAEFEKARHLAAMEFDEKADRLITDAKDEFDLKRAAHRAHHFRWRAERISPDYNPTKKVAVSGGVTVNMNIKYGVE